MRGAPARVPWPPGALRLALDLHAAGRLAHGELVDLVLDLAPSVLHGTLVTEHGRSPAQVEAYLRDATRAPVRSVAPGSDALDPVIAAVAGVERSLTGAPDRLIEHLIEAFSPKQRPGLTARAVVALLSQLARAPSPTLVALCVAIDPRVLEHASFAPAETAAAAHGLIRFRLPHRPAADHVERILRRPVVRGDLALAAAVAGLLPGKRLATLAAVLGEAAIVDALRARDHGWDAICRLPPEAPPRELGWLLQLADRPERFVALAAHALAIFGDKRREAFSISCRRTAAPRCSWRSRDRRPRRTAAARGGVRDDLRGVPPAADDAPPWELGPMPWQSGVMVRQRVPAEHPRPRGSARVTVAVTPP